MLFLAVAIVFGLAFVVALITLNGVKGERDLCQQAQLEKWYEVENYQGCLQGAYDAYIYDWNQQCGILGREENCIMNGFENERVEQLYKDNKEDCKIYMK